MGRTAALLCTECTGRLEDPRPPGARPTRYGLVALLAVLFDSDGDVTAEARSTRGVPSPAAAGGVGDGNRVDVSAVHVVGAAVVDEVLARACLVRQVDAVETPMRRGPDGPQIAFEAHHTASVERQHPPGRPLLDRPQAVLAGGGYVCMVRYTSARHGT